MKDEIMSRMKDQYEMRSRTYLPRRSYVLLRLDGVAFHTFTRGLDKPYDAALIADMDETAKYLCEKIQGAKFAYVQSDEISILLTDFEKTSTHAWFDNEVQKMVSVSAAMATAKFNHLRMLRNLTGGDIAVDELIFDKMPNQKLAYFDSRAFIIPDPIEVANYFIARQKDCTKNSISMAAQSVYSHTELEGKNSNDKQEMLFQKGINWDKYPTRYKRGGFVTRVEREMVMTDFAGIVQLDSVVEEGDEVTKAKFRENKKTFTRHNWEHVEIPEFTKDTDFLYSCIPVIASEVISLSEMIKKTSSSDLEVEEVDSENHMS